MRIVTLWQRIVVFFVWLVAAISSTSVGLGQVERSRFATEDSRSDYVHRIELYDSRNALVRPGSERPYSPSRTCGRCHDVANISRGFHFSVDGSTQPPGRPGEPWVWVDPTTGTQLPLSYRGWQNSYSPAELGISLWDIVLKFGRRTPGGYPGPVETEPATEAEVSADQADGRFHLSGPLEVDCMICHARDSTFDLEAWTKQIDEQNFAWASTVALGLATVKGAIRRLPDDFDVDGADGKDSTSRAYPKISYEPGRFEADGKVFLDIVRSPSDNACYRCHSSLQVGPDHPPAWTHEGDVHLSAGLRCVDCHPNALGHETVRGFEGEIHPAQEFATTLSCRGCHIGSATEKAGAQSAAGRLGAPYPEHRGLPPSHLERLSCTACHSGTWPQDTTHRVHTSRNHLLGQKGHRKDHQQPEIVEPVLLPDEDGKLHPHRVIWPSYWGSQEGERIVPLKPADVQQTLKSVLRVRRDFLEEATRVPLSAYQKAKLLGEERAALPPDELTDEERSQLADLQESEGRRELHEKVRKALVQLKESLDVANPAYVAGEKVYRLAEDASLEIADNTNPQPYAWPIGHDVRPARRALGAKGCTDCHASESPFLYASVTAEAPVPAADLTTRSMHDYAKVDKTLWYTWHELLKAKPLLLVALAGSTLYLGCLAVARGLVAAKLVPGASALGRKSGRFAAPWRFRDRLAYGGFIATVALLGVTSLTPMLRSGALQGWWLVAHMVVAGVYLGFVILMALCVSHRFRARPIRDWQTDRAVLIAGWTYWLMIGLSLLVLGSALAKMLPILATREIDLAVTVHRWCGITLLAIALIHPVLLKKCYRKKP